MREIRGEWTLVTGPAEEPIPLTEAKLHASIVQDDDNVLVDAYLRAARQAAELHLGRGLLTQTWAAQFSGFADEMWLPMAAPLQNDPDATPSTAPVVQYYDVDGVLQTLATSSYLVDTRSEPGCIRRAPNQSWPSVQCDRDRPVVITYVCGWTNADDVPELIKQGIRVYMAGVESDRAGAAVGSVAAAERCWDLAGRVHWRPPQCRS